MSEHSFEKVEYDSQGRMSYNPSYHENHGKPFTEDDLEYLCKYYEIDGVMGMSLALGRTQKTIADRVMKLRKQGKFDYYKNLSKHW